MRSARVAGSFEGLWAKTKEECLDEEGPNSRTLIDLGNVVHGRAAPIFDQYENHCLIEQNSVSSGEATLNVTCFEFWEEFEKGEGGRKSIIKLSTVKGGTLIDGKMYQRCEAFPYPSGARTDQQASTTNTAASVGPLASSETYELDKAWSEQIRHGACSRIRDRRTDTSEDISECNRLQAHQPLCMSYRGFAYAWFDMANESSNPAISNIDWTTKVINSLGIMKKNSEPEPEYYKSPQYREMLHRLSKVIFSPSRSRWKTAEESGDFAYRLCMEGHPF
jgi:hypothetical protein